VKPFFASLVLSMALVSAAIYATEPVKECDETVADAAAAPLEASPWS